MALAVRALHARARGAARGDEVEGIAVHAESTRAANTGTLPLQYPLSMRRIALLAALALVWLYSIVWSFVTDWSKVMVLRHLDLSALHHRRFLAALPTR